MARPLYRACALLGILRRGCWAGLGCGRVILLGTERAISKQAPCFGSVISIPCAPHVVAGPPRGICLFAPYCMEAKAIFFFSSCYRPGSGRGWTDYLEFVAFGVLSLAISKFQTNQAFGLSVYVFLGQATATCDICSPLLISSSTTQTQHNTTRVSPKKRLVTQVLCTGAVAVRSALRAACAWVRTFTACNASASACSAAQRAADSCLASQIAFWFLWE